MIERKVYNVAEVGMMLGVSRNTVYALVRAKEIPVLEVGRRRIIPKKAFDEWLEQDKRK